MKNNAESFKQFVEEVDADPVRCVEIMLNEVRGSNDNYVTMLLDALLTRFEYRYLNLLQPDDKEWLLALDRAESKAIVLAGMHANWKSWTEPFTDEETGKTIVITRGEVTSAPLFASTTEESKRLFEEICQKHRFIYSREIVFLLNSCTPYDYTRIIRSDYEAILNDPLNNADKSNLYMHGSYGWLCEELSDYYHSGREQFGYYIDIDKARNFYNEAKKAKEYHHDEELLTFSFMEIFGEEDNGDDPRMYQYTLQGPADELLKVKSLIEQLTQECGMPDNEFGRYIPKPILLNRLVGVKGNAPSYRGNLLFMEEEQEGRLVLRVEANEGHALLHALHQAFPALDIEMEF